jgi:O-Antigen ligase
MNATKNLVIESFRDKFSGEGAFGALVALMICAFLFGGGSRSDILSLIILRPLSVVALGYALWGLNEERVSNNKFLVAMAAAISSLPVMQLIPLPPFIWRALPGHQLIAEIDKAASVSDLWRPLSVMPSGTWNALYSLCVPVAALLLGLRLSSRQQRNLLPVLIGIGLTSAILAFVQTLGPADGPLYFYRISHHGSAVGLFANRNHQAVLLAIVLPMLSVFAAFGNRSGEVLRRRGLAAIAISILIIPLIVITGSRSGLACGALGLVLATLLYRPTKFSEGSRLSLLRISPLVVSLGTLSFGLLLVGLTILFGRDEALQRFAGLPNEYRLQAWGPIAHIAGKYFPFGSGFGSFVPVYQIDEPRILLDETYFNQAHNDWLELALTGGLPALILLIIAGAAYARQAIKLWRMRASRDAEYCFALLGLGILAILGFASVSDYPLRVPSMSCVLVVAILWATQGKTNNPDKDQSPTKAQMKSQPI